MWRRYLRLFGPDAAGDVEDEIRFHLETKTEELVAEGWSPDAARREAARSFGDPAAVRAWCEQWGKQREKRMRQIDYWGGWWQDVCYGLRQLRRGWGTTLLALTTLAVGIGAVTAVFSVLYAVVLHPLPFPDPDRLVMVWTTREGRDDVVTPRNFDAWRRESRSFNRLAALQHSTFTLSDHGSATQVPAGLVSADFLASFGVSPLFGRTFTAEEDRPPRARVALLSHRLWQERFGADPSILGQSIRLNRESYTVIGVMPARFDLRPTGEQLWVPLALSGQEMNWTGGVLSVVGRLRPDVSRAQAQAEMNVIARSLETRYPEMNRGRGIRVTELAADLVGDYRQRLWVLLGAVGFVLLIACANVANLLLAQGAGRTQEFTVRAALGASRARLVRQLMTESLLLAFAGAALGVLMAAAGVQIVRTMATAALPRVSEASVNGPVVWLALCLAGATTMLCGLPPALRAAEVDLQAALRQGGRSGATGLFRDRARSIYIAAEVALALVLLTGAGLLIRTALAAQRVDPGFTPAHLLTARTALPMTTYRSATEVGRTYERIWDALAARPGVIAAALASKVPLGTSALGLALRRTAVTPPLKRDLATELRYVSPAYFATVQVPVRAGREFTRQDRTGSRQVVIVNETLARKLWPGTRAIGQPLRIPELDTGLPVWEVVGMVADVRDNGLMAEAPPTLYIPLLQVATNPWHWAENSLYLVARTHGGVSAAATVGAAVRSVDPELPVGDIQTMEARMAQSVSAARLYTVLLTALGVCGLLLTAAGIYGVVAYFVGRQRPEIGVRLALGATVGSVIWLVIGQGMRAVGMGIALGELASLACSPLLSSQLYSVSPMDPLTLLAVAALLAVVAALACYVPARQAAHIDPMTALRSE
jgi:putative ABC transport system permease protein